MFVILAKDHFIVDEGTINPFIQTRDWWNQVPSWNNDCTPYVSAETMEEAERLLQEMPKTRWAAIQWSKER